MVKEARRLGPPALTSSVLPRHPNTIKEGRGGGIVFQRWGNDAVPALVRYCEVVCDGVFAGGAKLPLLGLFLHLCVRVLVYLCEITCVYV